MAYVNVDVDISDFEDEDLINELKDRGYTIAGDIVDDNAILSEIYRLMRTDGDYKSLIEDYVLTKIGRVI